MIRLNPDPENAAGRTRIRPAREMRGRSPLRRVREAAANDEVPFATGTFAQAVWVMGTICLCRPLRLSREVAIAGGQLFFVRP